MANRTLLFTTNASEELDAAQTLQPRINQADALGAKTLTEQPVRILAKDKNGNLVVNPVLTDLLNTEFVNILRRDMDGNGTNDMFVTFSSTSNAENGGVVPEKSLLVSMNDLIVTINVPQTSGLGNVTTESLDGDVEAKYYGKPINLDQPDEQGALWNLVANRTVRLHKNNNESVSGKWSIDVEKIEKRTPDVLHLTVDPSNNALAIRLDPSVVQTIPVIFTPDDGQEQFKLLLFIKPFDQRTAQKTFKISNSTATPDTAKFLRPWVITSTVNATTLTGAKGEGGDLKVAGLTNCVKATDSETGENVVVTVSVIPTVAAFSANLDAVSIPSVPKEFNNTTQLANLVEDGLFTVKATISATGYETQVVDLAVCINAADARLTRISVVVPDSLSLAVTLANSASGDALVCTTRHNEDDNVTASALASLISSSIVHGKNVDVQVDLTSATLVNSKVEIISGENGSPSGLARVNCVATGFLPQEITLPVAVTDNRLPDGIAEWTIEWDVDQDHDNKVLSPKVTIADTVPGANGDAVTLTLSGSDSETTGVIKELKNQWGDIKNCSVVVVGIVTADKIFSPDTCEVVDIPKNAESCWIDVSILTVDGLIINKRVIAEVVDERS